MLSDNIRKYRKLNHMSQDELAERLEVTRQSISLWETGQTQPSLDKIVALAKLFNVSTDSLLAEGDPEPARMDATVLPTDKHRKKTKYILIIVACLAILAALLTAVLLWETGAFGSTNETEPPTADTQMDIYGYLKDFVIQNGTINGDYCYYSKSADNYGGYGDEYFSLYYWGDTEKLEFCLHSVINEIFSINFYLYVPKEHTGNYEYISSYYYRDTGEPLYEAKGTITASEFTKNYPLNCSKYIGATDKQNSFMEESRIGVCDLLDCLKEFLVVEKIKYSFADFGFTKF